jgi:hypothetical protein
VDPAVGERDSKRVLLDSFRVAEPHRPSNPEPVPDPVLAACDEPADVARPGAHAEPQIGLPEACTETHLGVPSGRYRHGLVEARFEVEAFAEPDVRAWDQVGIFLR